MSGQEGYIVDWREQMSRLEVYLDQRGGVVHIRIGRDSPTSAFVKALRLTMHDDQWSHPCKSVQIDNSNASTHYLADIVLQLARAIDLDLGSFEREEKGPIEVAKDIRAGGDVHVHDISVSVGEDEFDARLREHKRTERLLDAIESYLGERRLAIIFYESHLHDRKQLSAFRTKVWNEGLERLVSHGLLLVDCSDPTHSSHQDGTWPPGPDCSIDLPDMYDASARTHATDDLADIAIAQGIYDSESEAIAFAETLIAASPNIRELHAGLARALLGLASG